MKKGKSSKYPPIKASSLKLKETAVAHEVDEPMVRTQIYLSQQEHEFIQREAKRRDEPMAAVIRGFIDEKMEIPEDAWTNNPMLRPTAHDSGPRNPEDMGLNLDHYLYGVPKDYIKVKGKYIEAPPLPLDYGENRASREAYDKMISEMDESQ